ncbi:MAG: helix-turn-helix domain-containing protein [Tessaracoccus sp.]|uniref:helix-turn-helix domain-containing protein n=1 Tax=Tessaracoccus sp. TaxID=1971211 RepID=UPI001EC49E4F|nr:helix-turn-helix domain-containing protein [Tessaracoccus sp.]MBK7822959.1 helix-turn-helix domain-containing protein [Tessaracoccus sp.]
MTNVAVRRASTGRKSLTREEMLAWLRGNVYVREGGCTEWAGAIIGRAYPQIMWHGKRQLARRLLVELEGRPLGSRDVVWSTCGNPKCMTSSHLLVGPRTKMIKDYAAQGRYESGAIHSLRVARGRAANAKVGIAQAPKVFTMRAAGMSTRAIARHFGVHDTTVRQAIKAWARCGINEMTVRIAA